MLVGLRTQAYFIRIAEEAADSGHVLATCGDAHAVEAAARPALELASTFGESWKTMEDLLTRSRVPERGRP